MQQWKHTRKAMTAFLPIAAILGTFYAFELRTENNIQRITVACEQSGRAVELKKMSWSGGVSGRCVAKSQSEDQEGGRPDD